MLNLTLYPLLFVAEPLGTQVQVTVNQLLYSLHHQTAVGAVFCDGETAQHLRAKELADGTVSRAVNQATEPHLMQSAFTSDDV